MCLLKWTESSNICLSKHKKYDKMLTTYPVHTWSPYAFPPSFWCFLWIHPLKFLPFFRVFKEVCFSYLSYILLRSSWKCAILWPFWTVVCLCISPSCASIQSMLADSLSHLLLDPLQHRHDCCAPSGRLSYHKQCLAVVRRASIADTVGLRTLSPKARPAHTS